MGHPAVLFPAEVCGRRNGPVSGTPTASGPSRVDQLFAAWDKKDAPGCAVGISRNGAMVYEHGYGMANLEQHVPITPENVFPIASITKSFTAMSVLLAAEQYG